METLDPMDLCSVYVQSSRGKIKSHILKDKHQKYEGHKYEKK